MAKKKAKKKATRQPAKAKPSMSARQLFEDRELLKHEQFEAERHELRQHRLSQRTAEAERLGCEMLEELGEFLSDLCQEWMAKRYGKHRAAIDAAADVIEAAYMEGCLQGFIEGRVMDRAPRRRASDNANRAKRMQLVTAEQVVDGKVKKRPLPMDMDERDALIYAEFLSLQAKHVEKPDEMLAEKHGMSDRHVRGIVLEQKVLREHAALVRQGMVAAEAADRLVRKYGVGRHGNPKEDRQASVRKILAKGRLRRLPELPEVP